MKEELQHVLAHMGLTLSEEKTKVTHITEGFDFLGYRVIRSMGRSGKMAPKVLVPAKALKGLQHKIRGILAPNTTNQSVSAKIQGLNQLIRGWCEYYRCTSSPSWAFNVIRQELFQDMAHWLGKKYKRSIPAVMRRFYKENTFRTNTVKLVMPNEYKAKRFVAKTWHNPYTETEKVRADKDRVKREHLFSYDRIWTGDHHRPGGMDLREEVLLRKGPICVLCGKTFHPSEVQMDHKIPRARFNDPQDADRIENLQILCTTCHRAKTKTDLKVLRRMR